MKAAASSALKMSTTSTNLVELTIDGKVVQVPAGTTVYDAARLHGIAIPTLCHLQNQTPVGVCRLCVVDTGARVLSRRVRAAGRARHEGRPLTRKKFWPREKRCWNC